MIRRAGVRIKNRMRPLLLRPLGLQVTFGLRRSTVHQRQGTCCTVRVLNNTVIYSGYTSCPA